MENGFRGYHPYVAFCYYICTGVLFMVYNHPLFLIVGLLMLVLVNLSHDKGQALKKWTLPLILMGTIFTLMNPLLVSRGSHILFYLGNRQITLEAFIFGFSMALTVVAIIILFVSFNLILNGSKFLFIFAKVLPRSAFLIMLSIRFVPLLKVRFDEISAVQRMRGMTMTAGTVRERARNGMNMIQTLLTWSLEEAIQTADSMTARGYGGPSKSSYTLYKMTMRDWLWLSSLLILFILSILGSLLGYGQIVIYPELGTLAFYTLDWILLGSMIVITSFPLVVEGIEYAQWKFFN